MQISNKLNEKDFLDLQLVLLDQNKPSGDLLLMLKYGLNILYALLAGVASYLILKHIPKIDNLLWPLLTALLVFLVLVQNFDRMYRGRMKKVIQRFYQEPLSLERTLDVSDEGIFSRDEKGEKNVSWDQVSAIFKRQGNYYLNLVQEGQGFIVKAAHLGHQDQETLAKLMERSGKVRNLPQEEAEPNKIKELTFMAFVVALDIILVRFFSLETPAMRIGFGFISNLIAGMYLGPLRAGVVGLVADVLGMILFPKNAFFPGFTLSAILHGVLAGYFLEGKKAGKMVNVVTYSVVSTVLISSILNTLWVVMMVHNNDMSKFMPSLTLRIPTQLTVGVLKIIFIPILYRVLFKRFKAKGVEYPGIR